MVHRKDFNQDEWVVIGDFNSTLFTKDKRGGNEDATQCMQEFRHFLNRMQLIDITLEGNSYTWSNSRLNNNNIQRKLDRTLATTEWRDYYQQATLYTLYTIGYDHSPLLLQLSKEEKKNSPFRFEYMWIQHKDFFANAKEWWNM